MSHCNYLSRCDNCRGKGLVTCSSCSGIGRVGCSKCNGLGRIETQTHTTKCGCDNGRARCSACGGGGKVDCRQCSGYGGFYHSATLRIKWKSSATTKYCQNSFLPKKRIKKAQRTLFWSNKQQPWSKESSIYHFFQSLPSDEPNEGIQLKVELQKQYQEELLQPNAEENNKMRRLVCTVERLDFEEVQYTLDNKYINKRDSSFG